MEERGGGEGEGGGCLTPISADCILPGCCLGLVPDALVHHLSFTIRWNKYTCSVKYTRQAKCHLSGMANRTSKPPSVDYKKYNVYPMGSIRIRVIKKTIIPVAPFTM